MNLLFNILIKLADLKTGKDCRVMMRSFIDPEI